MELEIVKRYYIVTLTKRSQLFKTKLKRFGNINIKLTTSLTLYLAFRIFGSIRHHSILGAFKNMCFRKGRKCCQKKVTKSKIGSKGFNITNIFFFFFSHIKLAIFKKRIRRMRTPIRQMRRTWQTRRIPRTRRIWQIRRI